MKSNKINNKSKINNKVNASCEKELRNNNKPTAWLTKFNALEKKWVVEWSNTFVDKVGYPIPHGQTVMSEAYNQNKPPNQRKHLILRYPFYGKHWDSYVDTKNHIRNIKALEGFKNGKWGTQSMIDRLIMSNLLKFVPKNIEDTKQDNGVGVAIIKPSK